MTKLTDLEGEVNQLKTDSNERMDRLELAMDNLRLEADKRHSELMALLMARAKSPPPLLPPPSEPPPSSTVPSSTLGPPFFSRPSQTLPHAIPYTIPLTLPQSIPPTWGFDSSESPPHPFLEDSAAIHTSNLYSAPHIPPFSHGPVSFVDTGQFAGDSGIGRGPGQPGDRPWISGVDYRMRKLKMPIFDGTDAFGWVYRLERYFDIQGFVTTGEKLRAAVLCMEGQALAWYRWTDGRTPFRHWEGLKHQLLERFQPSHAGDIHEQFLAICQEGSVRDYIGVFENLAAQLPRIPEKVMEGTFIKGLKPELRSSVRLLQPMGLTHIIKTALLVEESRPGILLDPLRAGPKITPSLPRPITGGPKVNTPSLVTATGPSKPVTGLLKPPFKRITDTELAEKRAKGLCFRCDGKFHPGHRCPDKTLQILLIAEDEEQVAHDEDDVHAHLDMVEVSAHSVMGLNAPRTMKLRGSIHGVDVVVLIDSGATHNFVAVRLLEPLHLAVTGSRSTGVRLGNGTTETSYGICLGVELHLPGLTVTDDFYPLELGGTDVILGIKWLRQLGDTRVNWHALTMTFDYAGQQVSLKGDPELHKSETSFRALVRELPNTVEGYWLEVAGLDGAPVSFSQVHPALNDILADFSDIFHMPEGLPPSRGHEHPITLKGGTELVNVRPYRYPQLQKNEIERLVGEMLEAGVIRPSTSPFSSPVLLVKKKDGSWRFCVDYRALNKATVLDRFPIPVIDELLDELHGATVFSKLDLKSGYHQIRMKESDVHKTAFRTHDGHFEFLVMPFGLTNAPSTFQALMNKVFRPYLRKFVLVFFDDILVYSRTLEQHREHLCVIFECLRHEELYCNRKKCVFGQDQVDYLGHIVTAEGVQADPSKISAMANWPVPCSVRELRGFLGLTGYYRKFVKDYGKIARVLTDLLKKDGFRWTVEATIAFNHLKEAMTTVPVLALPNFHKPFLIETDASGFGIGAVMMQEGRPIAFFSQALGPRARAKSVYERELMAIVMAVQKWRPYLLGRKFTVITDQKSLKFLLEQRAVPGDHQKWVAKLSGYDFDIRYRPGKENGAADALSRKESDSSLHMLSSSTVDLHDTLRKALVEDPDLIAIRDRLDTGDNNLVGYTTVHGLVHYHGRLLLPKTSSWVPKVVKEFHAGAAGGHEGVQKTYQRIAREFFWVGMRKDISRLIAECDVCQRNKHSTLSPAGLLQPLELPNQIWEDLTMDFIEGLPKSGGYNVIMVVVDRLSKAAHFTPLKHPFTAATVATIFIREIVRLHGVPQSIISDRDKVFLSKFWREMFTSQGTILKRSTAYHPQTDGQTEVVNRSLETYLRCFASDRPREWIQWLPWAEFWYNTSYHSTIGTTPFKVLYGRDPPRVVRYDRGMATTFEVDKYLMERDKALEELRGHFLRAQQLMKAKADSSRRDITFKAGDLVYLKLRPYRQQTVANRSNQKLASRFYGPFAIIEKIGQVAYRLQLPPHATIHPVFHVSQLKPAVGSHPVESELPTDLGADQPMLPKDVRGTRETDGRRQVLIAWEGAPDGEETWEDFDNLQQRFPHFHLEDKVVFRGESDDTHRTEESKNHWGAVYVRRDNATNKSQGT